MPAAPAATPSRVGPYSVIRPLGAGGMAETFVAERRGPGQFVQRVCLKRIRADLATDPELVRQFMSEAAIAARLRHATIASILDFGEDGGELYMAIELIDGVDLRELLHATPGGLPASLVLYIAVELATALHVAHGVPEGAVVHRDVSPSNVLLSRQGEVKLADFGIARSTEGPAHTRTGIVRGKVPYMAPEYARTGRFDTRADLFSLGVLLHECAYGVRPFDGLTDLETLERATRGERCQTPVRPQPMPHTFETILDHLIDPDPQQRFENASALLEALLSLPSDARARRELGARVSTLADAARASLAPSASAATELWSTNDGAAASGHPAPAATRTLVSEDLPLPGNRTGPRLALGAAALAVTMALTIWLMRPMATVPEPTHTAAADAMNVPSGPATPGAASAGDTPVAPSAPSEATVAPVAAQAPDGGQPQTAEPVQPQSRRARLEVIVMPFGQVYVDDTLIGSAPVSVSLRPGTHEVRVVSPAGTTRRRVELRPGARERIQIQ